MQNVLDKSLQNVLDKSLQNVLDKSLKPLLDQKNGPISKKGSKLTEEVVRCFNAIVRPLHLIDIDSSDPSFVAVRGLVVDYTFRMNALRVDNKIDEVNYVQPVSYKLFQDVCEVVLPAVFPLLKCLSIAKLAARLISHTVLCARLKSSLKLLIQR